MREFFTLLFIEQYSANAKKIQHLFEKTPYKMNDNTLYSLLSRLRKKKYLVASIEEADVGKAKNYHYLTESGQQRLDRMKKRWRIIQELWRSITKPQK